MRGLAPFDSDRDRRHAYAGGKSVADHRPAPVPDNLPAPVPVTPARSAGLDVQIHHQEHRLSCEAAALKMALAYLGISVDELTLIDYMGHQTQPARFDSRGRLVAWGDPNEGFVGDPDGHLENYTGYGAYFGPVAKAAVLARVHVVMSGSGLYGSGIPPADLYNAVLDGHPVVAWISNTYHDVPLASYVAGDGSTVWYTLTEHAVTMVGRPAGCRPDQRPLVRPVVALEGAVRVGLPDVLPDGSGNRVLGRCYLRPTVWKQSRQ